MNSKKVFTGIGATMLLAACAFTAIPETEAENPAHVIRPVKLINVESQRQGDVRRFPATVHAEEESMISFRVGGVLEQLLVKNAQFVKKGELLATLDDRDYLNEVALRQSDFDLASNNYQRVQSLWERKVVSKAELDNANTAFKSADIALKLAKDRLKDTVLKAPFDGRIARIDVENHQLIQPQQTILQLQNNDLLEVRIQVPENVIARGNEDRLDPSYQPMVSFGRNMTRLYPVTYQEHATSVTPGTLSYETTFTLAAPEDITVYPGMGATVHIDMTRIFKASDLSGIVIPVTAVLSDDETGINHAWVFNPESETVNPVNVTLGRMTQEGVHILSGLNDGNQIVAAGLSRLKPGMQVKPLARERGL